MLPERVSLRCPGCGEPWLRPTTLASRIKALGIAGAGRAARPEGG